MSHLSWRIFEQLVISPVNARSANYRQLQTQTRALAQEERADIKLSREESHRDAQAPVSPNECVRYSQRERMTNGIAEKLKEERSRVVIDNHSWSKVSYYKRRRATLIVECIESCQFFSATLIGSLDALISSISVIAYFDSIWLLYCQNVSFILSFVWD